MNTTATDSTRGNTETGTHDNLHFEFVLKASSGAETAFTMAAAFDLPKFSADLPGTPIRFQKVFDVCIRGGVLIALEEYVEKRATQDRALQEAASAAQQGQPPPVRRSFDELQQAVVQVAAAVNDSLRKAA